MDFASWAALTASEASARVPAGIRPTVSPVAGFKTPIPSSLVEGTPALPMRCGIVSLVSNATVPLESRLYLRGEPSRSATKLIADI